MKAMSRDCVFSGCMVIVYGLEEYPMGSTVHVQHQVDDSQIWFCIYEDVTGYQDVYIHQDYLSRITPEDEDTIERYWAGNGGIYA